MNRLLLLFLLNYTVTQIQAQKESASWYFGKKAGVTFMEYDSIKKQTYIGKPKALTNGQLSTEEGCATICNENGEILFYTDGISVWNKKHVLMKGGEGLLGNPSSTSSGVVLPAKDGIYYLFTLDDIGEQNGLCYSIIDLKKEDGIGELTQKNIKLKAPVTEKLTAVRHRNNKDIWVIAHDVENASFLAYLLTEKGIEPNPVISETGTPHSKINGSTLNYQGYMKASPDGSQIALALEDAQLFELFDFDNESGKLSNPITLKLPALSYPYGVEFSPDGSVFYGSAAGTGKIYQYNLQAGSPEKIQASELIVGSTPDKSWLGALQLGPDRKIYFTQYNKKKLGVIHNPEKLGVDCLFSLEGVELTAEGQLGLPTFFQSFFTKKVEEKKTEIFTGKVETNTSFILEHVYFEYDKADLKTASFAELDKLIAILKKEKFKIQISGHTDNIGNKSYNLGLSSRRANSVGNYLISKGIAKDRISTEGFGSTLPISDNNTPEGRQRNRRVEFKLM
jgi:outer membrane protein OmpA-like peptidoglycan-associated protein